WRIVVHGGIDGFSRLIVYLSAATNNRATTVLDCFLSAVEQFGLPSRVRSGTCGENIEVAHYMVSRQGENRNSHIPGRSVHNQSLESEGLLNPDKEIELFALHRCFVPQIQQHLFFFKDAWNHHGLRTAGNQSPLQLWLRNQREGEREDPPQVNINELNIKLWMSQNFLQLNKTELLVIGSKTCSFTISRLIKSMVWTGQDPITTMQRALSVPEIQLLHPLSEQELATLPSPAVPFSQALAVYLETVHVLTVRLEQNAQGENKIILR
ncbi:hypothetical protein HHUSO_G7815, partial [Huso huso]